MIMRRRMRTPLVLALALGTMLTLSTAGMSEAASPSQDYVIGNADVLQITVWGHKDLDQVAAVRPDGKISLPLAGEVKAAGLSVPQLAEMLAGKLSASVKNPSVSVMVKEINSYRVYMVGRVAKPGVHPIQAGTPLLQALTLAGGVLPDAGLSAAYVIRGNVKIPVNLRKLVQDGDLSQNIALQTDDTIVVPEGVTATNEVGGSQIYLLGKFVKPGVYPIKQGLPVLHALFLAGGMAPGADPKKAFLVRGSTRLPVDLDRLIQEGDLSQNLTLEAGDTLTIPEGILIQNGTSAQVVDSSSVFVMGEVRRPGPYPRAEALTVLKLMAMVGGFTDFAAPNRTTLIRKEGDKKVERRINVKDIMSDPTNNEDLQLKAGDVLVVPAKLF
jgi:polysaccharide export outer membrane protein